MKVGILTFHYSTNYGGVLQSYALFKVLEEMGYNVEIINFVPASYNPYRINIRNLISKENKKKCKNFLKKFIIQLKYNKKIYMKFEEFRKSNFKLSKRVNEETITSILNNYDAIIVGSDQVWNPWQRKRPEYFLDFGNHFTGKKISYAADSTTGTVEDNQKLDLYRKLQDFNAISVRNVHSQNFISLILDKNVPVVSDPTLLYDFNSIPTKDNNNYTNKKYILAYILGQEIEGTHEEAINQIKEKYPNMPVYFITIPTYNFEIYKFVDKYFYDIDPIEWVNLFKNASFIYTDSFHGVLFSLKYQKPFLAYYKEYMRSTRFIDLGNRYQIEKYIVKNVNEIITKKSLNTSPDYNNIRKIIESQRKESIDFLKNSLKYEQ